MNEELRNSYQCTKCGAVEQFSWRNKPFKNLDEASKNIILEWFRTFHPNIALYQIDDAMLESYYEAEKFSDFKEQYCVNCGSNGPFVIYSYTKGETHEIQQGDKGEGMSSSNSRNASETNTSGDRS